MRNDMTDRRRDRRLGDERREGMSVAPNLTVSFRLFLSPYAPQARAKAVGRRPPKGASPVCDASGVENEVSTERSFIVWFMSSSSSACGRSLHATLVVRSSLHSSLTLRSAT